MIYRLMGIFYNGGVLLLTKVLRQRRKEMVTKLRDYAKYLWLKACLRLLKIKWSMLQPYYVGLLAQAKYLYRQSELYKLRWREMNLDFAEETFENDAFFFFKKAQKSPLLIRFQIFMDALLCKEPTAYYLADNGQN